MSGVPEMELQRDVVAELRARIAQEISSGILPAAQFAFGYRGVLLCQETLGDAPPDARFNMFSSTKALTAAVMWQLLGEGKLDLQQRVTSVWPGFARQGKDVITIEHLLVHSAGIPTPRLDRAIFHDRTARVAAMEEWELE